MQNTLRAIAPALQRNGLCDSAWIVRHTTGSAQATAISYSSQPNAIGQGVGGPDVGWIGTAVSLSAALTASALLMSPMLPLLVRDRRMEKTAAKPD